MATKIVFANHKGGVGKTTSVLNTSAFLALMGHKVLCMDFDPQSSLTISFGIDITSLPVSLSEVFLNRASLKDSILSISENLDIVPARADLSKIPGADMIACHFRKNEIIKYKIGDVEKDYDFILMDTSSSKDLVNVLTINCFAFADFVIIPLHFEHLSLVGLSQQAEVISDVRKHFLNRGIQLLGILGTAVDGTNNNKEHAQMVSNSSLGKYLFTTRIRRNTHLSSIIAAGVPITKFKPKSHGYIDYQAFATELLARLISNASVTAGSTVRGQ